MQGLPVYSQVLLVAVPAIRPQTGGWKSTAGLGAGSSAFFIILASFAIAAFSASAFTDPMSYLSCRLLRHLFRVFHCHRTA